MFLNNMILRNVNLGMTNYKGNENFLLVLHSSKKCWLLLEKPKWKYFNARQQPQLHLIIEPSTFAGITCDISEFIIAGVRSTPSPVTGPVQEGTPDSCH